jgi:hypothetical protein
LFKIDIAKLDIGVASRKRELAVYIEQYLP